MVGRSGRWLCFLRKLRYGLALIALSFLMLMLGGCMEALQSSQSPGSLPPAPLPSMTDTAFATASVAEVATPSMMPSAPVATTMSAPAPTLTASATVTATPAPVTLIPEATFVLPTQAPLSYEERWRAQEINRVIVDPPRTYTTSSSELWWFDPINQQHIILGTFSGDFLVQAQFTLRSQGIEALEVPYQVNRSYGLTALSPAIMGRIAAAGNGEWIETYVFVTLNVVPR